MLVFCLFDCLFVFLLTFKTFLLVVVVEVLLC